MNKFMVTTLAGALAFTCCCNGVSIAIGQQMQFSLIILVELLAGAVITICSHGLIKVCRRTSRHIGAFSLTGAIVCLAATVAPSLILLGSNSIDLKALAAVAFYGLITGLGAALAARLVNPKDKPSFDYLPLLLAGGGVAGLLICGWLNPVQMPASANIVHVTTAKEFQREVEDSQIPVVVDFGANWCGPCRCLAPNLDTVAGELAGKVKFVAVDVDQLPALRERFDVEGLPSLLVFKDGKEVSELRDGGYKSVEQLRTLYLKLASNKTP